MNIGDKIRAIREAESLTRQAFGEKTSLSWRTIEAIETAGRIPSTDKAQAICEAFPHYTLWLMTNQINIEMGQISPEIQPENTESIKTQKAG